MNPSWQDLNASGKVEYMISSGHLADCSFIVGRDPNKAKTFACHKMLLACASPVFEAMFYGDFTETEVRLPDVEPLEFRKFIEFVYFKDTEYLKILPINVVLPLATLGNKYMVTELEKMCIGFIKTKMNTMDCRDLINVFVYANQMNNTELLALNIAAIRSKPAAMTTCSQIYSLSTSYFYDLLKALSGHLTEEIRFELIETYIKVNDLIEIEETLPVLPNNLTGEAKNEIKSLAPSGSIKINDDESNNVNNEEKPGAQLTVPIVGVVKTNHSNDINILKKDVVSTLLSLINFHGMTGKSFCNGPGKSNLLTIEKKYELLTNIFNK